MAMTKKEQTEMEALKTSIAHKNELSEAVRDKLAEAVQLWADENLPGRPAILGYCVYSSVEAALLQKQKEIEETFKI